MDTKELIRGGYEDGQGVKRESRTDVEKSSAASECAFECVRWLKVNSQLWPLARGPSPPLWDPKGCRPKFAPALPWLSPGPPAAVLSA